MAAFIHLILTTFLALFPITNPFGNAGIFLSLTAGQGTKERQRLALRGAIFMFCILESFLIGGGFILRFFDLSLAGIRIAGGLLIARFAFNQLQPKRENTQSDEEQAEAMEKEDISFSPLAIPLLAGPGAIATVMSISSLVQAPALVSYAAFSVGILLASIACWIVLRQAEGMVRFLGVNGANALTKIMGFLLLCIGVQLIINGIVELRG